MFERPPNPPKLALWLLRRTSDHDEALTGDLVQRYREGESLGWFWAQVFFAFSAHASTGIRRRWPFFCYAIVGTIAVHLFNDVYALKWALVFEKWNDLPWPLSQFAFELGPTIVAALTSLLVLAACLAKDRLLRVRSLLQTFSLNLTLIALGHCSSDICPWLLRSIIGNPYHKSSIVPPFAQMFLVASAFLFSAWLGCPLASRVPRSQ